MLLGYSLDKCLHLFGKGSSKIAAATMGSNQGGQQEII